MIWCKELGEYFEDKKSLFKALVANKDKIIKAKKSAILKSCDKGLGVSGYKVKESVLTEAVKGVEFDTEKNYYIATNTTRILDSHEDLHLDGIWNKTVKEQQGKNYLVFDHEYKATSTIVKKEHIKMFVATIPFSAIGKNYEGETEALIYEFPKDKVINPLAKEWLESNDDIESSVRMQYVKMSLCLNADEEEFKEERKNYEKYHPIIANKDDFEEIFYFWAIGEAKNVRESSLVLAGSNNATGQVRPEPSKDTQSKQSEQDEAVIDTSAETFFKHLKL